MGTHGRKEGRFLVGGGARKLSDNALGDDKYLCIATLKGSVLALNRPRENEQGPNSARP